MFDHVEMRRWILGCAGVALAVGCTKYDDSPAAGNTDESLARFQPISVALDEGYVLDTSSDYYVAGKGIELRNPNLTEIDTLKPQSVIYEFDQPQCVSSVSEECPDEGFRFIGVRYTAPADAGPPPTLDGETFLGPVGDPPVYELYTWFNNNPNGTHATTNPMVQPPEFWPQIYATWKGLNDQFPTPDLAIAAGYTAITFQMPDGRYTDCVPWPAGKGGMGYHFVKLDKVSYDPASVDPAAPQGLVYERKADGSWLLGAEEWFLWTSSNAPPPNIAGFNFDGPMPPHGPGQAEHYDLHAYVGYLNPDGLWTKWNRRVGCPFSE